jgi:molybdenum cofactor cytidylyltransferase
MKFGPVDSTSALGLILAHGLKCGDATFKKGRVLSASDVAALFANQIETVWVAQIEATDVTEDEAARRVAVAIAGRGTQAQEAFTGRANLYAAGHGLLVVDADRIRAINHLHESLTIATLPPHDVVAPKQMVATVKIIPFSTPRAVMDKALAIIGDQPLLGIRDFQKRSIHLIITSLPQTKTNIIAKSETAIAERLKALGLSLASVTVVDHTQAMVARAIADARDADLIMVFGASAIVDRGDVIPAALVKVGGQVTHLGMPVDPGNLLMLGQKGETPVIGIPSCARSPKRNGFDWVLERVAAGLAVLPEDIMDMGVGGLLAEIPSRPSPRETDKPAAPRVVAVVLAAGSSKRMGSNKMLASFHGKPMLRATVENVLATAVDEVVVVTGHHHDQVEAALQGLKLRIVHNQNYADGMSTSLRSGVLTAGKADAVVVCLGDMPRVGSHVINRMIAAFNPTEHRTIIVPVHKGQWGNPVLWGVEHFDVLCSLEGDKGARALIQQFKSEAVEIDVEEAGVLMDADTPEALAALEATTGPDL